MQGIINKQININRKQNKCKINKCKFIKNIYIHINQSAIENPFLQLICVCVEKLLIILVIGLKHSTILGHKNVDTHRINLS